MVLLAPSGQLELVRDLDRDWAEHLLAEATRFERIERRAALRRAGACLFVALGVVALGLAGFIRETDTRLAPVHHVRSSGSVTVTLYR